MTTCTVCGKVYMGVVLIGKCKECVERQAAELLPGIRRLRETAAYRAQLEADERRQRRAREASDGLG